MYWRHHRADVLEPLVVDHGDERLLVLFLLLEYLERHGRGLGDFRVLGLSLLLARLHHVYDEGEAEYDAAYSVERDFKPVRLRHLAREAAPYFGVLLLLGGNARERPAVLAGHAARHIAVYHMFSYFAELHRLYRCERLFVHGVKFLPFPSLCRRALCRARAQAGLCRSTGICRAAESTPARGRPCRARSVRARSAAP